jgi:hypothetical protein
MINSKRIKKIEILLYVKTRGIIKDMTKMDIEIPSHRNKINKFKKNKLYGKPRRVCKYDESGKKKRSRKILLQRLDQDKFSDNVMYLHKETDMHWNELDWVIGGSKTPSGPASSANIVCALQMMYLPAWPPKAPQEILQSRTSIECALRMLKEDQ